MWGKKCPSLGIRKMQIKMRYHLSPVRMHGYVYIYIHMQMYLNTKTTVRRLRSNLNVFMWWWEYKQVQPLWGTVWGLLQKLKIDLPYEPAMPLLGIYPKEMKSTYRRSTCMPMFVVTLFIVTKKLA